MHLTTEGVLERDSVKPNVFDNNLLQYLLESWIEFQES